MTKKLTLIVVFAVLLTPLVANSQVKPGERFANWTPIIQLPAPINSKFDDQAAVLSQDELTIYFSSNRTGSLNDSRDIWVSKRATKRSGWQMPVNLGPVVNSTGTELVRSLTPDGRILLFQSDRIGGNGQADIWVTVRKDINNDFDWSEPANLGSAINTPFAELASNYLFTDGGRTQKLLYSSNKPGGFGGPDIYESTINDLGFTASVNVFELNTPSIETCFWIREDGLEIIFSSNRPNLTEDRSFDELWIAHRNTVYEPWSAPVNLGTNINTAGYQDVAPYVTSDGKTMLMSSKRPGGWGPGTFDIYMSTRSTGGW